MPQAETHLDVRFAPQAAEQLAVLVEGGAGGGGDSGSGGVCRFYTATAEARAAIEQVLAMEIRSLHQRQCDLTTKRLLDSGGSASSSPPSPFQSSPSSVVAAATATATATAAAAAAAAQVAAAQVEKALAAEQKRVFVLRLDALEVSYVTTGVVAAAAAQAKVAAAQAAKMGFRCGVASVDTDKPAADAAAKKASVGGVVIVTEVVHSPWKSAVDGLISVKHGKARVQTTKS